MKTRSKLTNLMKLCSGAVVASVLSVGLLGGGDTPKEQEAYTIKFSHVVSSGTPKGKAADLFAKRVEELSNGKIKVEVFPSTQLVDDDKVFQELKRNMSKWQPQASPNSRPL